MSELTDRDRGILDLESEWFRFAGVKEQVIRERFDLSATAYFQQVNRLLNDPAAALYAPQTVRRLQRIQAQRLGQRRAGRRAS